MEIRDRITTDFRRFCKECLLDFFALEDGRYLTIYKGNNWRWPLFCNLLDNRTDDGDDEVSTVRRIIFTSEFPMTVPAQKREVVGRYLHLANWEQVLGKFEFDEADGEIRFATSLEIADGEVTTCMLFALFDAHRHVDYHLSGLQQLLLGFEGPAEADLIFDSATHTWLHQGRLNELWKEKER